jgi:hypothetical protein
LPLKVIVTSSAGRVMRRPVPGGRSATPIPVEIDW